MANLHTEDRFMWSKSKITNFDDYDTVPRDYRGLDYNDYPSAPQTCNTSETKSEKPASVKTKRSNKEMAVTDKIIERVKKHEGFRDKPYFDTVGKVTIGYGRNIEDNPLTVNEIRALFNRVNWKSKKDAEDWAERLMRADLEKVAEELNATLAMWPQCSKDQQTVLIDLGFNIGIAGLMTFKGMLEAVDNEEPTIAAYELLNSRYARQTKNRAIDNARLLAETNQNFDNALSMLEVNQYQTYKAIKEYI